MTGARSGKRLEADVFVIGAGVAGAAFARELIPAGVRVTMVDAGPTFSQVPGWNLKNAVVYQRHPELFATLVNGLLHPLSPAPGEAPPALVNPRQDAEGSLTGAATAYAVGGMAIHWTGVIPRQHPTMEREPVLAPEEWDALYADAERALGKTTGAFDGSVRHRVVRRALAAHYDPRLEAGREVGDLPMALRPGAAPGQLTIAGMDTVLAPILEAGWPDGLALHAEHAVIRLHHEGGRVTHVEGIDLANNEPFTAHAEHFVVAAGTVLSAQLLHASGIRPEANGRYLIEHPISFAQVHLGDALVREIAPDTLSADDLSPNVWIPVGEGRPWHVQVTKDVVHFSQVPAHLDDRLVVDLRWYARITPRAHHRVRFEDDLPDALGLPRPTFAYRLDDDNEAVITQMREDQREAAGVLGRWVTEPVMLDKGTCLHLQGATRMGREDDGTCVVDPDSRVWGFDNLSLAGNGVIPGANACNPTLTTVALALRAARALLPD